MDEKTRTELVKASLIAGLKLWGLPNTRMRQQDTKIQDYAKKFGINLKDFRPVKKGMMDSGLCWYWDEKGRYGIEEKKFSERIYAQSEAVGFEDLEECMGNSMVDSFEYVFWPDGTGFTGFSTEDCLLEPTLRWTDGKLYTYWAEGLISIYTMDIKTMEEANVFVKKLIETKGELNGKRRIE